MNELAGTFLEEALQLITDQPLQLPDLGPFEPGDLVLDELTELEKALFLTGLAASLKARKIAGEIEEYNSQGLGHPCTMDRELALQENKAAFTAFCAKFLFLQRLKLVSEIGVYLRYHGVIVVNEELAREDLIEGLLTEAEEYLPELLGQFFRQDKTPPKPTSVGPARKKTGRRPKK